MSHQEGATSIHQIFIDSNVVPMLGLRPFSNNHRIYHGLQPLMKVFLALCGVVRSHGFIRVRPALFIRSIKTKILPYKWRIL